MTLGSLLFALLPLWAVVFDMVGAFAGKALSLFTKPFAALFVGVALLIVSKCLVMVVAGVYCGSHAHGLRYDCWGDSS